MNSRTVSNGYLGRKGKESTKEKRDNAREKENGGD